MKSYFVILVVSFLLMVPSAHAASSGAAIAPSDGKVTSDPAPITAADSGAQKQSPSASDAFADDDAYYDEDEDTFQEERVTIADPIEPFNRAMHTFNDRMYFWLLKPVARGYKTVVPEPARLSVKHFFKHWGYPARVLNCLLQGDFTGMATETGRFAINTVWGIGGLMDPAAGGELQIPMQDTDLGHTLALYGAGHGFYIVWPIFGPSSPRDTTTLIANQVLYPISYLYPWYVSPGVKAFEMMNAVSMRIGDYESLVEAAIDPYVAIRNAYIQYRMKEVEERRIRSVFFRPAKDIPAPADEAGKTP